MLSRRDVLPMWGGHCYGLSCRSLFMNRGLNIGIEIAGRGDRARGLAWGNATLPDEGRYAGVAWKMLRSGSHAVPLLDGMPYFHRSDEHTSELQSIMCNSSSVFCLTTKNT